MRTPKLKVPSSNALDEVASVPVAQAHVHFRRLDVLINNTGLNLVGTVESKLIAFVPDVNYASVDALEVEEEKP